MSYSVRITSYSHGLRKEYPGIENTYIHFCCIFFVSKYQHFLPAICNSISRSSSSSSSSNSSSSSSSNNNNSNDDDDDDE